MESHSVKYQNKSIEEIQFSVHFLEEHKAQEGTWRLSTSTSSQKHSQGWYSGLQLGRKQNGAHGHLIIYTDFTERVISHNSNQK